MQAKSLQSCLTLCDPMDRSPPGSSVHGILQARILEWVAMPSSRGSRSGQAETRSGRSIAKEKLDESTWTRKWQLWGQRQHHHRCRAHQPLRHMPDAPGPCGWPAQQPPGWHLSSQTKCRCLCAQARREIRHFPTHEGSKAQRREGSAQGHTVAGRGGPEGSRSCVTQSRADGPEALPSVTTVFRGCLWSLGRTCFASLGPQLLGYQKQPLRCQPRGSGLGLEWSKVCHVPCTGHALTNGDYSDIRAHGVQQPCRHGASAQSSQRGGERAPYFSLQPFRAFGCPSPATHSWEEPEITPDHHNGVVLGSR